MHHTEQVRIELKNVGVGSTPTKWNTVEEDRISNKIMSK